MQMLRKIVDSFEQGYASLPWVLRFFSALPLIVLFFYYLLKTRSLAASLAAVEQIFDEDFSGRKSRTIVWYLNWGGIMFLPLLYLSTLPIASAFFASLIEEFEAVWLLFKHQYFEATFSFKDGLTFSGYVIGVGLLFWRAKSADKQVRLNEDGLDADRFRDGCQMLTDAHYLARHGGIVTLSELARGNPKLYEVRVIDVLTDFLRRPDAEPNLKIIPDRVTRPDMHQAFLELASLWKSPKTRKRYCKQREQLNLENVYLYGNDFENLCLQNVSFLRAQFFQSSFLNVDFRNSSMQETVFSHCHFSDPNFEGALISGTVFEDCSIVGAKWDGAYLNDPKFTTGYRKQKSGFFPSLEWGTYSENFQRPAAAVSEGEIAKAWVLCPPGENLLVGASATSGFFVLKPERWGVLTKFRELTFEEITGLKLPEG